MAKDMVLTYLHFRILKISHWSYGGYVSWLSYETRTTKPWWIAKKVHETIQWMFPPSFYSFLLWFILTNTGLILQVGRCRKNVVGPQYDPRWLRSFQSPSNSGDRPSSPFCQVRSPGTSSSFKRFSTFAATSTGEYLEELLATRQNISSNAKNMTCVVGAKWKVKVLFWDTPFYCSFCDQLPSLDLDWLCEPFIFQQQEIKRPRT